MPQNWSHIGRALDFKEKFFVLLVLLVIVISFLFWIRYIYHQMTQPVPKAGGEYVEGIIGQPIYVNPLLSQTSEADSDLVQLIFSGLLKYDKNADIVNDLAESYEVSEDRKTYTVKLKENLFWHDGEPLQADDVKFTIGILQDPMYKSPLRYNWEGVKVNQLDDRTISFELNKPYFGFPDNLTVKILPKHIWQDVSPEKFSLAEYNLNPIGSGPYEFVDFQKDSSGNVLSYELKSFGNYFEGAPYIPRVVFNFYPDGDSMVNAFNKKEISGMGNIPTDKLGGIKSEKSTSFHELSMPRFFAVFLNQNKSKALADDGVREALSYATNREEIIREVLQGRGIEIFSPLLPQMKEFDQEAEKKGFDLEKAKNILEENGWKINEETGIREKDGEPLKFTIHTTDWAEITKTAEIVERQWEEIGAEVDVIILSVSDIQQNHIRPREYDALLFGQVTNFNPDLYPFFHSSYRQDPGVNLSNLKNEDVDKLLEEIREGSDEAGQTEKYKELQKILREEVPAIFIYTPLYIYPTNDKLRGFEVENVNSPSWRFSEINKWYVKEKRVKK